MPSERSIRIRRPLIQFGGAIQEEQTGLLIQFEIDIPLRPELIASILRWQPGSTENRQQPERQPGQQATASSDGSKTHRKTFSDSRCKYPVWNLIRDTGGAIRHTSRTISHPASRISNPVYGTFGDLNSPGNSSLCTPFHKYRDVFGVRKLACALCRRSLLRRRNAREASVAL